VVQIGLELRGEKPMNALHDWPMKPKTRLRWKGALRYVRLVVIIGITVINVFPIYWMVLTSFRPEHEILSKPPKLLPIGEMTWQNYKNVLSGYAGKIRITENAITFLRN
jgi:ABC-type glycerol-3-phosphate transport system permease component